MKKSLLIAITVFSINHFGFAQNIKQLPGNHPEVSLSEEKVTNIHVRMETIHKHPKLSSLGSGGATESTERWPSGTWDSYYTLYAKDINNYPLFYEGEWSNHPTTRYTARYLRGYIHAFRSLTPNTSSSQEYFLLYQDYEQRAKEAIEYLISEQNADGSFSLWQKRPYKNFPDNRVNIQGQTIDKVSYTTGESLSALCEGYWFLKCELLNLYPDLVDAAKAAIIKSADYVSNGLDNYITSGTYNSNVLALLGRAMALSYKSTGNLNYFESAKIINDLLINTQHEYGFWNTGDLGDTIDSYPKYGPAELTNWISGDFNNDGKEELVQCFNGKQFYMANSGEDLGRHTLPYGGTGELEMWITGNFQPGTGTQILHKFKNNPSIYLWKEGLSFGTNSVYSGSASLETWVVGDFDGVAGDEVLQKFRGSNSVYLSDQTNKMGINKIYSNSNQNYGNINVWAAGDFDGDGKDEVVHNFHNNNSIYLWHYGGNFGSGDRYPGTGKINRLIVGNFDNDPADELAHCFESNSSVYLWNYNNDLGTDNIYFGSGNIDKWLSGDYDGDGRDEIIQTYEGSNSVYLWNHGSGFGTNPIYDGLAKLKNMIFANINTNDPKHEVFHQFENEVIYLKQGDNCFGCLSVFNLPKRAFHHDQGVGYHMFILHSLVEMYSISSGGDKDQLATTIKKAINNIVDRTDPDHPQGIVGVLYDENYKLTMKNERTYKASYEAIEILPKLNYYAKDDTQNFTSADKSNLINLGNYLHKNYSSFGFAYYYYKDYMNVSHDGTYLDYYGGCEYNTFLPKIDVDFELDEVIGSGRPTIGNGGFLVYPNPAVNENPDLTFISNELGNIKLTLVDAIGKIIWAKSNVIVFGRNTIKLGNNILDKGFYQLKIDKMDGTFETISVSIL
jgi:hypothetical protein